MRALVLWLVAVVVAVIVVACSGKQPCGAANCGTCCDATDTCVSAVTATSCGAAGNTCRACSTGETCSSSGTCVRASAGGGSGTGGSGGAGGSGGITCPGGALPPVVPITFPSTCPVPTACGGNPQGKFDYTAACIGRDEFQTFVTQVEQVCGAGSVTVNGFDGGVQGYAFFQGNRVCRTALGSVTVYASITTGFCAANCSLVGSGISAGGYSGSCMTNGSACDCTATRAINISTMSAPYTTDATSLTITSTGQRYETCLTGNVLTTRQTQAGDAGAELGVATLTGP